MGSKNHWCLSGLLVIVSSVIALAWCYWPFALHSIAIAPWFDTIFLTGPLFCEIGQNAANGKTAIFNWSSFEPLHYNAHVATYYPLYFFGLLDFCSPEKASQASDIIALVHISIMYATTVLLVRLCGAGLPAAAFGAAMAMTSSNVFVLAAFPTIIAAAAWLPLAIAGLVLILFRDDLVAGFFALVIGTSAMLTAGPGSNMLAALVFVAIVLGCYACFFLVRSGNARGLARIALIALASGIAVAFAVLASTINLFAHMDEFIRWTRTGSVIGSARPSDLKEILTEQMSWSDLHNLVVPPAKTAYALGAYFVGPAAVILAIVGAVTARTNRVAWAFSLVGGIAVFFVFLAPSFIVQLWAYVPGLSHVRHLSVLATPIMLAIAVLSALGSETLMTSAIPERAVRSAVAVSALGVAAVCMVGLLKPVTTNGSLPVLTAAILAECGLVALLANLTSQPFRQMGFVVLAGLQAAMVSSITPRSSGIPVATKSTTWLSVQQALDWIEVTDRNTARAVFHPSIDKDDISYTQAGSAAAYRNMPTFHFYSSPRLYWKFMAENYRFPDLDAYGRMGGRYILSMDALEPSVAQEVFRSGDIKVFKLNSARPLVATVCTGQQKLRMPTPKELVLHPGRLPQVQKAVEHQLASIRDGKSDCSEQHTSEIRIEPKSDSLHWFTPPGRNRVVFVNMPPYSSWTLEIGNKTIPAYDLLDEQTVAFVPDDVSGPSRLVYQPDAYWKRLWFSEAVWLVLLLSAALILVGRWNKAWSTKARL